MHPEPGQLELFTFDLDYLLGLARQNQASYRSADPFPHIVIDNFLPLSVAEAILRQFPGPDSEPFINRSSKTQPGKFGTVNGAQIAKAPPFIQHILAMLNSYPVLAFLTELTGIEKLITDPNFSGGGLHQIVGGGKLNVHADFNYEPKIGLYRRLNLLIYLNKDWKESNGGYLELWDRNLEKRWQNVEPAFNRCVIFNTDRYSYHGHPVPVAGPEGTTRKSIALYYYTTGAAPGDEERHSTLWPVAGS